jgi:hypothetical protein
MENPAEGVPADTQHRPLYVIAHDIRRNWPKPHFAAFPYIYAMRSLNRADEMYGADSALSIIAYFLSNASTWRGPEARRIKSELREILKGAGYV